MTPRERFPRTTCDCAGCKACCRAMPGMLAPGDAARIAALPQHQDASPTQLFAASQGALVVYQGQPIRIPTIVPASKPDGTCVFLDEHDRCSIHAVAPFGCSHFDTHQDRAESDSRSSAALQTIFRDIQEDGPYARLWHYLFFRGKHAPPLLERKAKLAALLAESAKSLETH